MSVTRLALSAVTLDEELQPRAAIDRAVLENYVQLLVDGVRFPPVIVFNDGETLWLSDGFHRWHAHKVLDADSIEATVHEGTRRQALLYSLSANAKHGLQRGATDYTRAYEIACKNRLVDPADVEAVATLLQCSGRWAEKLTAKAREPVKAQAEADRAERNAEIIRLKDEGKTHREVAEAVGVAIGTISAVQQAKSSQTEQADPPAWVQTLRELESPEAQARSSAVAALRLINEQLSVDELYARRFVGYDHVVSAELEKAYRWISELQGRFVNERDQRRRA